MYELAKLTGYRITQDGTELRMFIPKVNLQEQIESKHIRQAGIWLDDGRLISSEQRKKAYATIADIARWTGYLPEECKEQLKYIHIARTGCEYFSLSSCTMDTAREFINTILDVALEQGIILDDIGVNRTDDIGKYMYSCLIHHRCSVCGCMGQTRSLSDMSVISLCEKCNDELTRTGETKFHQLHKVYGLYIKPEELLKIEGVNNG